ncbi:MAG: DUF4932 domain-containing protein [bacterium]|nr:DUF4932 domain-containing protein [bacterium]
MKVAVDPRVELISLIFRLSGTHEYGGAKPSPYLSEIDARFGPCQGHRVVALARALKRSRGVSFDAPMSLACHLEEGFSFQPRVPLDPWPPHLDTRWTAPDVQGFLAAARDFADTTKYREFYTNHQGFYTETCRRLERLIDDKVELAWYDEFFGPKSGAQFRISPALLNGGSCYGPRVAFPDGQEFHCMLGVWLIDHEGVPVFDATVVDTIIHEFCHSYVNPIMEAHFAELEPAAVRLFANAQRKMERMAYGHWETMVRESGVRACVVRYLQAHGAPGDAERRLRVDVERGFVWLPGLVELLDDYEAARDRYPTLETFMPEIVRFFGECAEGTEP